ncbi:hypothetical protein [Pseudomonas phage vB_PsaM_M1]|nr:hypothetical protein [Pseudomonas phage vB_PsaM_M1]
MTLTINDTRNNQKGILWESLEAGHVYIDCYGNYVMAIESSSSEDVVNLSTGDVMTSKHYNEEYDEFVPVKAKLEIFG